MEIPTTALFINGLQPEVLFGTDAMIPAGVDHMLTKQRIVQGDRLHR